MQNQWKGNNVQDPQKNPLSLIKETQELSVSEILKLFEQEKVLNTKVPSCEDRKHQNKLQKISLEFKDEKLREFYALLFEQWSTKIFHMSMIISLGLIACFTLGEALLFQNKLLSILYSSIFFVVVLLWIIGTKWQSQISKAHRICHLIISFIMFYTVQQIATEDTYLFQYSASSNKEFVGFFSIIFSLYQIVYLQVEVKWYFKGIFIFIIIFQAAISLIKYSDASFIFSLTIIFFILLFLYQYDTYKKESTLKIFKLIQEFISLKTLINDILPMKIFIVSKNTSRDIQQEHLSLNNQKQGITQEQQSFECPSFSKSPVLKIKQNEGIIHIEGEHTSVTREQLKLNINQSKQIEPQIKIQQSHFLTGQLPKIYVGNQPYNQDEKNQMKNLKISFINKNMAKAFGGLEQNLLLAELNNIYLPTSNKSSPQVSQQKRNEKNLLDLLSQKLNSDQNNQEITSQNQAEMESLNWKKKQANSLNEQQAVYQPREAKFKRNSLQSPQLYNQIQSKSPFSKCKQQFIFSEDITVEKQSDFQESILPYKTISKLYSPISPKISYQLQNSIKNVTQSIPFQQINTISHSQQQQFKNSQNSNIQYQEQTQTLNKNEQNLIPKIDLFPIQQPQIDPIETIKIRKNSSQNGNNKVSEYQNCTYSCNEKSEEENTYDIRLIECKWEGEESVMVIMSNINERQIRLRQQQIEEYKDSVIDSISHNLKTPLNSILAPLECVKTSLEKPMKNEEGEEKQNLKQIGMAINNCQLLLLMINDLIDYSQIIKGNNLFRFDPSHFRLNSLVKSLINLFEDQMESKKIEFKITSLVSLKEVILFHDERRLVQILVNLISNSLKFTLKGKIELLIDSPQETPSSASLNGFRFQKIQQSKMALPDTKLRFTIKDTGIGMTPEQLQNLQDRLSKKISMKKQDSSELGLTMCFALLEKISAPKIFPEIQSSKNVGTIISFTIQQFLRSKAQQGQQMVSLSHLHESFLISRAQIQEQLNASSISINQNEIEIPNQQLHLSDFLAQYQFSKYHTKRTLESKIKNKQSKDRNNYKNLHIIINQNNQNNEHILDSNESSSDINLKDDVKSLNILCKNKTLPQIQVTYSDLLHNDKNVIDSYQLQNSFQQNECFTTQNNLLQSSNQQQQKNLKFHKDQSTFYTSILQKPSTLLLGKRSKDLEKEESFKEDEYCISNAPPLSRSQCEEQSDSNDLEHNLQSQRINTIFDNTNFLKVEYEENQKLSLSFGGGSEIERISENKSHITTQKYHIASSASRCIDLSAQFNKQDTIVKSLRWMLPSLQTEQNIEGSLEKILGNKHILIVDDTIYNIMTMKILIKNIPNLEIEEAYNGRDALEKFQNYAIQNIFFDYIFMDIEMPIMKGTECIQRIRQFEFANKLKPTIIISVTAYERDLHEVLKLGANGLISKPILKNQFLQVFRRLTPFTYANITKLPSKNSLDIQ